MKKVKAWMPLYVADFLIATLGWDAEVVGHYIRLLLIQWDRGSVPADLNDWDVLSKDAIKYKDVLETKFPLCDDGLRRNVRLEEEREKAQAVYSQKVKAGKKGARKRWGSDEGSPPVESSSASHPPPIPSRNAATRGQPDARKAFELAPVTKKQGWKSFLRDWNELIMNVVDPDVVIKAFEDYYASPQGQGKYARGPRRLLEDAVWEDSPDSWELAEGTDRTESMEMLDKINGEGQ